MELIRRIDISILGLNSIWLDANRNRTRIEQFRYIKIQPETIDLSTRLWGITTEFVGFILQSPVLRFIVLGWILIYQNRTIVSAKIAVRKCPAKRETNHLLKLNYSYICVQVYKRNKVVPSTLFLVFTFPFNRVSFFGCWP